MVTYHPGSICGRTGGDGVSSGGQTWFVRLTVPCTTGISKKEWDIGPSGYTVRPGIIHVQLIYLSGQNFVVVLVRVEQGKDFTKGKGPTEGSWCIG